MSVIDQPGTRRFDVTAYSPDHIEERVSMAFDSEVRELVSDVSNWNWKFKVIPISELTIDESTKPTQNAAVRERKRAIARAKLKVGAASPIIVVTHDNIVVEGHAKAECLIASDEQFAAAYCGYKQ